MFAPAMKQFFESNPRKSAFMVVGLKVAQGAEAALEKRGRIGGNTSIGVDAAGVAGVPVSAGPEVKGSIS